MSGNAPRFILASASPRRVELLKQIGVIPDQIVPADINETPIDCELPKPHAERLAIEKALKVAELHSGQFVLAADTVVGVGRRILPKTETEVEARNCLALMSGRSHRVFTGVAVVDAQGVLRSRVSETRLKMKRLTPQEIEAYIASGEWHGKAGGYGIQGRAGTFIVTLSGSYTGVVGLPVFETRNVLSASGFPI